MCARGGWSKLIAIILFTSYASDYELGDTRATVKKENNTVEGKKIKRRLCNVR